MRKSILFRLANCFMVAIVSIYTCGFTWNPFELGKSMREKYFPAPEGYKDPLLPFIKLNKKVSQEEFYQLICKLDADQKKALWKSFNKKELNHTPTETELLDAMHSASRHWATRPFTDFNYHETVKWTAQKLGVHKTVCNYATTFQLEHKICETLFEKMWDKLSQAQKEQIIKEANLPTEYAKKSGAAICAAITTAITTTSIAAATMGFAFYILMAKTVVIAAASVAGVSAATTISTISVFCGPVGWAIAGVALITALSLTGSADVSKCASFIIQVHMMKINALGKSGVDITPYILE